jgi:DNA mismatch repair protein MutS
MNETSIYKDYFSLTNEYQSKYGENTVLLMQVGSFFEIYGLKNTETGEISHSKIMEITQICQFNYADKKTLYHGFQVMMAGFPKYFLDKHVQKITDADYTAVVYTQEKNGKETTRHLHHIYSPGTYVSYEEDSSPQMSNHIMCIWFDLYKPLSVPHSAAAGAMSAASSLLSMTPSATMRQSLVCGVATANIYTGKSFMSEFESPFYMNPTSFDELERMISVYHPSEVIVLHPFEETVLKTILQYSGLKTHLIHSFNHRELSNEKVQNCMKQKYIQHILSLFYGEEVFSVCAEFQENMMATQAFCYLLNFIQEHNPDLVKKIGLPKMQSSSDRMVLANHTLKQLNIIEDHSGNGKKTGVFSSVLSFLNRCCTAMGKRSFQMQLLNPTTNEKWLTEQYCMIDNMISDENKRGMIDPMRKTLSNIRDLEKIARQIILRKIYPSSIYHLYHSIQIVQQIHLCFYEFPEIMKYLCSPMDGAKEDFAKDCSGLSKFIENYLEIENTKGIHSMQSFEQPIIRPGVSVILDELLRTSEINTQCLEEFRNVINGMMRQTEKSPSETEYVKLHETEKSGISIQITRKRGELLKKLLNDMAANGQTTISLGGSREVPVKDIKFIKATSTNDEIECSLLHRITRELLCSKEKINDEMARVYLEFIQILEKDWFSVLEQISGYVSSLDVLLCKSHVAIEYHYCKPMIASDREKSFVDARELRHCLIEQIQQNEIYVPNDIVLGAEKADGILLYGTNAVGKTSMIRALGIAVIMAQSGMFVPCTSFEYKPYTSIFSRILGNDNLFKGLSTFAVEMSELRMILKMADSNSLILGDELCSGTETESALSIFMAGLMDLHSKRASFIFATHFHEILGYDEMKDLRRIIVQHLAVHYDRQLDALVYDRKLKEGSGARMYGLEVCKSLYLPETFLETAYSIRNKYHPDTKGGLSNSPSSYNSNKIRGICEMCREHRGEEIHHLQQQKEANDQGFIGTFHKNHPANLMSLCEKCHHKIHSSEHGKNENKNEEDREPSFSSSIQKKIKKVVRKKTTKGYTVEHLTDEI